MRFVAASLAAAAIVTLTPSFARADGDPASDYLLTQNVFLPFDVKIPTTAAKQLTDLVANARRAGFRIRVAVIGTRYDLGSVTDLYGMPQRYAEFLGTELMFVYRGRLLVVMPNGYGYSVGGKAAPRAAIDGIAPPGRDPTKLVAGAEVAVRQLAAAAGTHLRLPGKMGGGSTTTRDRIIIGAAAAAGLTIVGGATFLRRMRSRSSRP